jgi:5'-nucleotidase (lipoprotein e(P4) family)
MYNRMSILLASALVLLPACRSSSTTSPAAAPHRTDRRTHENLNGVLWVQTSVEYRASAQQAYRVAARQLDAALRDPAWTAAPEQARSASTLPPAVVLDLDETVLDNSAYEARLARDGRAFSEEDWNRWCEERKAGAVPGAIEFLAFARSRGVTPVYISNRDHSVEQATRDVMVRLGAPIESASDTVLTRHENGWESSDKGSRRQFAAGRYRILLLIGDNLEDFVSIPADARSIVGRDALARSYDARWATNWIMLPNPMYGSWEQAVTAGVAPSDDAGALRRKFDALRVDR